MTDFKITGAVWLHNRVFKPGQERVLQEAGFTAEQKEREEAKGNVDYFREAPGVSASDGAIELAEENGVDLSLVTGTGPKGRIYQRDVQQYIEAREE